MQGWLKNCGGDLTKRDVRLCSSHGCIPPEVTTVPDLDIGIPYSALRCEEYNVTAPLPDRTII